MRSSKAPLNQKNRGLVLPHPLEESLSITIGRCDLAIATYAKENA